ncbi:IclR family transcriptional regulator [Microbispora sp. NPDC046933]|uniref:IclR family transcriptional regulator n=1 Tax=Microbispora sp. NPDC046933 TaxID=3155618 RepID=UPI0033D3C35A
MPGYQLCSAMQNTILQYANGVDMIAAKVEATETGCPGPNTMWGVMAEASPKDQQPTRNNSSSLRRAIHVLNEIAAWQSDGGQDCALPELSKRLSMSKSTVHRLLAPLIDAGLVEQSPYGYRLGQHTAYLGGIYLDRLDLRSVAREHLESLVASTGETAHLVLHSGTEMTYIDKVESPAALRMHSRVGVRMPLYCTGAGKALLAYLPAVVDEVIARGLPSRTPTTIVDGEELRRDLARTRERGYSVDEVENEPGIRCVGAVVFGRDGRPAAAISLSGPENRLTRELVPRLGPMVAAEADRISKRLGSSRFLLTPLPD